MPPCIDSEDDDTGSQHAGECLWDGKADQFHSAWDSVADWADYHAPAWARWQAFQQDLVVGRPVRFALDSITLWWNDGCGSERDQLANASRCVSASLRLRTQFGDFPEIGERLDSLTSELERRWQGVNGAARSASATPSGRVTAARSREGWYEFRGPTADESAVAAWATDYVRLEPGPAWHRKLRTDIRSGCAKLTPPAGEVLHATFFGEKRPNADIENLALYNIDQTFNVDGREGLRFEHGAGAPIGPDGEYSFGYRYELSPRSGDFNHWRLGQRLAFFDWIDLRTTEDRQQEPTKLACVWLALARGRNRIQTDEPFSAVSAPFAVRVQIRPPEGQGPALGRRLKGIFDGVISAFQAHTDVAVLPEVVARLAALLHVDPGEIEEHLLERRWAVLGAVPRLVSPYRKGVKWDPADNWCLAGDLLAAGPAGQQWAVKGELFALTRWHEE